MYRNFIKRGLDILFSLFLLIFLLPVFTIIFCLLLFKTRKSPFFTQERPGMNERIFTIYKFKTMSDKRDAKGLILPDRERLTSLGGFLRKTSLDEIPQLFNVLKGDMSFIGPRPLLISYLPYYTKLERKRSYIRPGITGLAQVSGRNYLSWDKRLELDVYYYEKLSFVTDLKILLLTIKKVLTSKDVNVDGSSQVRLDQERCDFTLFEKNT